MAGVMVQCGALHGGPARPGGEQIQGAAANSVALSPVANCSLESQNVDIIKRQLPRKSLGS